MSIALNHLKKDALHFLEKGWEETNVGESVKAEVYFDEAIRKIEEMKELAKTPKPAPKKKAEPTVVLHTVESRLKIKRTVRGIYDLDSSIILYLEVLLSIFQAHMDADGEHGKISSRKLWTLMSDRLASVNTNTTSIMRTVDRNVFPSLKQEFGLRQGWANDPENHNLNKRAWLYTNKTIEAIQATVTRLHGKVKANEPAVVS